MSPSPAEPVGEFTDGLIHQSTSRRFGTGLCGSRTGAAYVDDDTFTCPACRAIAERIDAAVDAYEDSLRGEHDDPDNDPAD